MVELRKITKRFGDFVAVDNIDLRIEAGEFLTLLGPSGCGKTTLLRVVSGFETPTNGDVLLDGRDVTALPPYRRDVNQVFQSYALFPHLTVADNIAFGLKMKRIPGSERQERVREAIALVSMTGFERRKPSQLSGGQKQRVALARALVCQPRVLLLDEPLAALDAKLRRSMQIELKRLQSRVGITFVFVTHDQEEALVMSDRVAVMNRGKIEQLGAAMDVYHKPATAFVADFLGQANVLEAKLISRDTTCADLLVGGALNIRVPLASLPDDQSVGFVSIRPERIGLSSGQNGVAPVAGSFPVRLKERIFRGATEQFTLESDFCSHLMAVRANNDPAGGIHSANSLFANFHPDDLVILPATQTPPNHVRATTTIV